MDYDNRIAAAKRKVIYGEEKKLRYNYSLLHRMYLKYGQIPIPKSTLDVFDFDFTSFTGITLDNGLELIHVHGMAYQIIAHDKTVIIYKLI